MQTARRSENASQHRAPSPRTQPTPLRQLAPDRNGWRGPLHVGNRFYLATGDIYATQQLLGHADVSTTANI
jgi:hypothetical protein